MSYRRRRVACLNQRPHPCASAKLRREIDLVLGADDVELALEPGQFDDGWDAYRERTFKRAKELGGIPAYTQLTPRDPTMTSWAIAVEEGDMVSDLVTTQ